MPLDTFEAAEAALSAAATGDGQPAAGEQAPNAAPGVDAGTTPSGDSFTGIDPQQLPEELKPLYNSMLTDYRQKTQQAAELRKQYEGLGSPDEVAQAVAFAQALQEDPLSVYNNFQSFLSEAGLLPGQEQGVPGSEFGDEFDQPDPLRQELDELKAWRAEQENSQAMSAAMFDIQREESAIRNMEGRNYSDDDINTIYDLAFAHGGSLLQAEEAYRSLQDRITTALFQQKGSVPAGMNQPGVTGSAQIAEKFETLDDPNLAIAAETMLRNALGSE